MSNPKIPTRITDKNGKQTTVHKNVDARGNGKKRNVPAPKPQAEVEQVAHKDVLKKAATKRLLANNKKRFEKTERTFTPISGDELRNMDGLRLDSSVPSAHYHNTAEDREAVDNFESEGGTLGRPSRNTTDSIIAAGDWGIKVSSPSEESVKVIKEVFDKFSATTSPTLIIAESSYTEAPMSTIDAMNVILGAKDKSAVAAVSEVAGDDIVKAAKLYNAITSEHEAAVKRSLLEGIVKGSSEQLDRFIS